MAVPNPHDIMNIPKRYHNTTILSDHCLFASWADALVGQECLVGYRMYGTRWIRHNGSKLRLDVKTQVITRPVYQKAKGRGRDSTSEMVAT